MNNIPVIYWSSTGNTEIMANAICNGADGQLYNVSEFDSSDIKNYDKVAFGCPAMGAEVLEENEFEPLFAEIESSLKGKKVALFGSYGWGDGQWMKDWENRVTDMGGILFENGLIINDTPDNSGIEKCTEFGKRFADA